MTDTQETSPTPTEVNTPPTENTQASPTETKEVLGLYDKEAALGRSLLKVTNDRVGNRYPPYVNPEAIPKELLAGVISKEKGSIVTEKDVRDAKSSSFGIALECATETVEAHFQRTSAHEDLDSLTRFGTGLLEGERLRIDLERDEPEILLEQTKKTIARRLHKDPSEVEMDDTRLKAYAQEQFQKARNRIGRSANALKAYLGQ